MRENWKTYELCDVAEIKYGKDHKHLDDGIIPLYGSGGIMRYVEKPLYDKESILIPRKGTLKNLFYMNEPFWTVDTLFYTKIKDGTDAKYLYYLLKTLDLASLDVGSAVPSLTTAVLNRVKISLPNLPIQKQIADILTSLDDKIELNLQINKTLESIAQNLFKEWFVNFNFPGFNGNLINGLPKGWNECIISDFGKIICGKTPSKKRDDFFDGKHMFIKIPDMHSSIFVIATSDTLTDEGLESQKTKTLPAFSICVSSIATVGLVCINSVPSQTNQQINSIVPNEEYLTYFLYFLMKSMKQIFIATASGGTATLNMNTSRFSNLNAFYPTAQLLLRFNEIVDPLMKRILANEHEIKTLIKTRDTLLPKLMSGALEVQNN